MRSTFQTWARELVQRDPFASILSDDYGYRAFDGLQPPQFYAFGPMEQTIVGVAAGLAMGGRFPIVYGITPFLLERAFEQLKLDICQQKLRAIFVTYSNYPGDGPTHRELDAYKLTRLLGIEFLLPKTPAACIDALEAAYRWGGPSWVQLS